MHYGTGFMYQRPLDYALHRRLVEVLENPEYGDFEDIRGGLVIAPAFHRDQPKFLLLAPPLKRLGNYRAREEKTDEREGLNDYHR